MRLVSKQGQLHPYCHFRAKSLSRQVSNGLLKGWSQKPRKCILNLFLALFWFCSNLAKFSKLTGKNLQTLPWYFFPLIWTLFLRNTVSYSMQKYHWPCMSFKQKAKEDFSWGKMFCTYSLRLKRMIIMIVCTASGLDKSWSQH